MNPLALVLLLVSGIATLAVPRRWAAMPMLIGTCYMTMGQLITVGPFNFHLFRILLGFGLLRVALRGEWIKGGTNSIDIMVFAWGLWVVIAGFFHEFTPGSGPVYALGTVYNTILPYYLFRIWLKSRRDLESVIIAIAIILVPIAFAMWLEVRTVHNPFSVFGGVNAIPIIREGRVWDSGAVFLPILGSHIVPFPCSASSLVARW